MLSGTATFELDGDVQRLGAQQEIEVESGVPHQMRNDSAEPLEFLVTSQPPGHGDRIVAP